MSTTISPQHLICAACGYDLRSHGEEDRCPECNRPVRESFSLPGFIGLNPVASAGVRQGLTFLVIAALASTLISIGLTATFRYYYILRDWDIFNEVAFGLFAARIAPRFVEALAFFIVVRSALQSPSIPGRFYGRAAVILSVISILPEVQFYYALRGRGVLDPYSGHWLITAMFVCTNLCYPVALAFFWIGLLRLVDRGNRQYLGRMTLCCAVASWLMLPAYMMMGIEVLDIRMNWNLNRFWWFDGWPTSWDQLVSGLIRILMVITCLLWIRAMSRQAPLLA